MKYRIYPNLTFDYFAIPETTYFLRTGQRDNSYVIDKQLTATGFTGTEDIDWENLYTDALIIPDNNKCRAGLRDGEYVIDITLTSNGFSGTEGTDWVGFILTDYIYSDELWTVKREGTVLSRSSDKGVTWNKSIDIGDFAISSCHVFANGAIFILSTNSYCKYSLDWITLSNTVIYDLNNVLWDAAHTAEVGYPRIGEFLVSRQHRHIINIDGVDTEFFVWGTYYTPCQLWVTKDYGATIHCIYRFRHVRDYPAHHAPEGSYTIIHVHNVDFNPSDKSFWITCGDGVVYDPDLEEDIMENRVIKATYNTTTQEWTFTSLGNDWEYKWCNCVFIGDYVYWSWDTNIGYGDYGGVMRCLVSEISNIASHERVLLTTMDCVGIVSNGIEMIAWNINTPAGAIPLKDFYYTPNCTVENPEWTLIKGQLPHSVENDLTGIWNVSPPDSNGNVRASIKPPSGYESDRLRPSVNLTSLIKMQGFPNAFNPL